MTWKLKAVTGEFVGKEIIVDQDKLVGRHQDADILLQSAEISRRHAALLLKDQQLWVKDLNSSNGTFINDERIVEETELHEGDCLQFASFVFSVFAVSVASNSNASETEAVTPHDEGMPSIAERAADTTISRDGMPQNVGIPKPAPIPENADLKITAEPEPIAIEEPVSRVAKETEQQKNASVGLISIIVLIILAIIAWVIFHK